MMEGELILLEGPGGCGKSLQGRIIEEQLKTNGVNILLTREPGGNKKAEEIRKKIFELKAENKLSVNAQIGMFFLARLISLHEVVVPALLRGKNVLLDRSAPSTNAFQGYGEGGSKSLIKVLTRVVYGLTARPNLTLFYDIPVEVSLARRAGNTHGDPYDLESSSYLERVRNGYLEMARTNWCGLNWKKIDGTQEIENVKYESLGYIDPILLGKRV